MDSLHLIVMSNRIVEGEFLELILTHESSSLNKFRLRNASRRFSSYRIVLLNEAAGVCQSTRRK